MNWLDQVFATPLIGVLMTGSFSRIESIRNDVLALADATLQRDESVTLTEKKSHGIEIHEKTGYSTIIDPKQFTVEYRYNLDHETVPGKLPRQVTTTLTPFSELLDGCKSRANELIRIFSEHGAVQCARVGLIMRTTLDPDNLPPGIQSLLDFYKHPFTGSLIKVNSTMLSIVDERDDETDRCHHHLNIDTLQKTPQMDFTLDWQRLFSGNKSLARESDFRSTVEESISAALEYATEVADGSCWRE